MSISIVMKPKYIWNNCVFFPYVSPHVYSLSFLMGQGPVKPVICKSPCIEMVRLIDWSVRDALFVILALLHISLASIQSYACFLNSKSCRVHHGSFLVSRLTIVVQYCYCLENRQFAVYATYRLGEPTQLLMVSFHWAALLPRLCQDVKRSSYPDTPTLTKRGVAYLKVGTPELHFRWNNCSRQICITFACAKSCS